MTKIIASIVLVSAMVGPCLNVRAAEQPALDVQLKPLAKLIGHWTYEWKSEKGQVSQGHYVVRTVAGGKAILARDCLIRDGKVTQPSLDITYWQPETKSIADAYFGSDRSHNVGALIRVGPTNVYQLAGFDGQGRFCTSVQHQEWLNDDTFVWRETLRTVGRETLPDQQCTLRRFQDAPPAVTPPVLCAQLQPLARALGKWKAASAGVTIVENDQADAGGAAITSEGEVTNAEGRCVHAFFWIIHWQPETKSWGALSVDSLGSHTRLVLGVNDDLWTWQGAGYTGRGVFETLVMADNFQDDDTFVSQAIRHVQGGVLLPDQKPDRYKRIKD